MPEVHFRVRWPDEQTVVYYSPSTAVYAHFAAGESYELADFLERSRAAMQQASERVRAKYGYTCSSAMDTLAEIETKAEALRDRTAAKITVLGFSQG